MNPESSPNQTPFAQLMHLTDCLNIIKKRKWIVIIVFMTIVGIVTIKTFRTIPIYKASAQIIIEGPSSFMDDIADITYIDPKDEAYYVTQHKLLRSENLASKVVKDLRLREYHSSNKAEKQGTLGLRKVKKLFKTFMPPSGHNNSKIQSMQYDEESDNSPPEKDSIVSWYLSNLEIAPVPNTYLVEISFLDRSPEMVARVANAHARAFIESNVQVQRLASRQTLNWLRTQLKDQKDKIMASQRTVNKHKYEQLSSFDVENEMLFSLPEIAQNPVIKGLRDQLARLKVQKLEMETKYGSKHPKMIEIISNIEKSEQEIINEVERLRATIRAELDMLVASEKSIQQTQDVPESHSEQTINYNILQLEVESDQAIYDFLLKQAGEINLTGNVKRNNIRIVNEARIPLFPYKPKIFLNILISVVLGLTFGIGLAFCVDYIDNTIKNPEDIIHRLGMPVIGMLPYDKSVRRSKTPALPFNYLHSERNKLIGDYSKYYNTSGSLVAGLPVGRSGTSGQILMVESTTAGEGKTTILAKSAISLARGGQRVVMVDADLPRSYLHRFFGVENNGKGGLVDAMTGILSQNINNGDLRKCSVDDLFSLIALRKQSGQLIIKNDKQSMTAVFKNGHLFHIQSSEGPINNTLGFTLLRGGYITASQLKDALERNLRTGQPLGYILINAGYITQDKLQGPLKLQAEETLQRLFSWKQGTFTFEECSTDVHEDKRIFFQEDYVPIINRLSSTAQSNLIESEVLSCVKSLDEPNLSILTAGIGHANAEGPLYYGLLAKFLNILKQRFDVVLIDSPPVLPALGYVKPLVSIADGVIFVVKAGGVSVRDINKAKTHMKDAKANIIGTILNQAKGIQGYYNII